MRVVAELGSHAAAQLFAITGSPCVQVLHDSVMFVSLWTDIVLLLQVTSSCIVI